METDGVVESGIYVDLLRLYRLTAYSVLVA